MKKEITMWEHPYNLGTFGRNVKEYGLASSLRHDLKRTKENMKNRLESFVDGTFLGACMIIAVPILIYGLCYKAIEEAVKDPFGKKKKEQEVPFSK